MKGLFLSLRKPEIEDIDIIEKWFFDPLFMSNLFKPQDSKKFVCELLQKNAKDSSTEITFIADNQEGKPVGLIMFQNLNWKHRHIEMNNAIGNPEDRQGFYGPELYMLGLLFAFTRLNLHQVYGYTFAHNNAAKKLNGFAAEVAGILPQHIWSENKFKDVIIFSILKSDFKAFITKNQLGILQKYIKNGLFDDLFSS